MNAFDAYLVTDKGLPLSCRVFDPKTGDWYTGAAWSAVEADAQLTALTEQERSDPFENAYHGTVSVPDGAGLVLEYYNTSTHAVVQSEYIADFLGTGDTAVNHNTGGADNLRLTDDLGAGISNSGIVAYLKTDYDAANLGLNNVKGTSRTRDDGRWLWPIMLNTGLTYTIMFHKQGSVAPTTKEVTP